MKNKTQPSEEESKEYSAQVKKAVITALSENLNSLKSNGFTYDGCHECIHLNAVGNVLLLLLEHYKKKHPHLAFECFSSLVSEIANALNMEFTEIKGAPSHVSTH